MVKISQPLRSFEMTGGLLPQNITRDIVPIGVCQYGHFIGS